MMKDMAIARNRAVREWVFGGGYFVDLCQLSKMVGTMPEN